MGNPDAHLARRDFLKQATQTAATAAIAAGAAPIAAAAANQSRPVGTIPSRVLG